MRFRNAKALLSVLIILLLFQSNLIGQDESKLSFDVGLGLNYTDVNYGNEFVLQYLKNDDYNGLGASGEPAIGFNASFGLLYKLGVKNKLRFDLGYTQIGYNVDGNTSDLKQSVTRPLSNEIPIKAKGRINYSFFKIGGDFIHKFNRNTENGLFFLIGLDYLINLNTTWKLDVEYETGNKGTENNLSEITEPEINNLFLTNIQLGYQITIKNKFSINPAVGVDLGLNSIHGDTLNPFGFSFGIRVEKSK